MDQPLATALAEWKEWAAYNLAARVERSKVRDEMIGAGLSAARVDALLEAIESDPLFHATRRHAETNRKWESLMDALTALEALSEEFGRIPRRSGLTSAEFLEQYYCANRPVILTDIVPDWPAFEKWDLAHLQRRFGDEPVQYQRGRSGGPFYRTFSDNRIETRFGDYIDLVRDGGTTNDHYLIAHDRMLERPGFAALIDDMRFDDRYFDAHDTDGRLFFWLGPEGSMTHMHRDLGNVFLAQIRGRKQVKMVPAKQLHRVYNEVEYYSEANFDEEDFADFPLLREATVIRDVIEPGELLLIPVGWWHFLKSLDVTISVTMTNFRFSNDLPKIF